MVKRSSTIAIAVIAVAAVLIVGVAIFALSGHTRIGDNTGTVTAPVSQAAPSQNTGTAQSSGQQSSGKQQVRLQDTPYWNFAHLISDPTMDSATKQALAGFSVKRTVLSNGTIQVDLTAQRSGYRSQTYMLEPGQKLYFIETSFGDDAASREFSLGDDAAVKVDANGYVL